MEHQRHICIPVEWLTTILGIEGWLRRSYIELDADYLHIVMQSPEEFEGSRVVPTGGYCEAEMPPFEKLLQMFKDGIEELG